MVILIMNIFNLFVFRKIMIRIDEPDIVLANDIENRNSEAILLNAQLNIDIIQNKVRLNQI